MNIAITAASGHLGAAIVKATVQRIGADHVVAVARTPEKAKGLGVAVRPGSYDDRSALELAFEGIDTVLLVSGMDAPEKRIDQHRNVIEAAKAAGVRKMVYTSIQGPLTDSAFSPIVQSNRQTEDDLKASGLDWVIGRNGIYIEPDVDYIDTYKAKGEVANCAGDGLCGYTTRPELADAYTCLLTEAQHTGQTYNLHGERITQTALAHYLSDAFDVDLRYRAMSVEAYRAERIAELGEFLGSVIAGIYQGIRAGAYDAPSDFERAAGRAHQAWPDYFAALKAAQRQA
ncbi:NAD(P)H-binding protein [Denitromonas ohlonensis]|uniref:SDR family NAD(P)-dependent oxidoreductase n=2 Tax=Denitromonas TaxID=139331 RepID=A0A557SQJ8_9RHOO|nr:NAD(P)H-binding protein [Denitromonas ohlonensis]TVO66805.1 SDR family NAD(P)-dependent oxidoreductase [Denitromonas ohlonensis]TVO79675.1 SDR family NAD(P)-dependent oxidoreductase [Denitromonas ohlonensis]